MNQPSLDDFEKLSGYTFNDKTLLLTALTHSSYIKNNSQDTYSDNERLEFLGDAVLELCVSEYLFKHYRNLSEGVMTVTRANAVCESALYACAVKLGLQDYILMSRGEEASGGRQKPSILSDAFEAIIGAIHLDGGFEPAKMFILSCVDIQSARKAATEKDNKTRLQELVQEHHIGTISYLVTDTKGPVHKLYFTIEVKIDDEVYGEGKGYSKQEAGQHAAAQALEKLNVQMHQK